MACVTPEKKVQDSIIKYLKGLPSQGYLVFYQRRNAIGANYKKGLPDLYVVVGSTHIEVEVKEKDGELSTLQFYYKNLFEKMGTPYILAHSFREFIDLFEQYLKKDI